MSVAPSLGMKRGDRPQVRNRRLCRSGTVHRYAGEALLQRDVCPAGVLDPRAHGPGYPDRRRGAGRGRRPVQTEMHGKMEDVGQHGRTVILVSHDMPAITGCALARSLLNKGRWWRQGGTGGQPLSACSHIQDRRMADPAGPEAMTWCACRPCG